MNHFETNKNILCCKCDTKAVLDEVNINLNHQNEERQSAYNQVSTIITWVALYIVCNVSYLKWVSGGMLWTEGTIQELRRKSHWAHINNQCPHILYKLYPILLHKSGSKLNIQYFYCEGTSDRKGDVNLVTTYRTWLRIAWIHTLEGRVSRREEYQVEGKADLTQNGTLRTNQDIYGMYKYRTSERMYSKEWWTGDEGRKGGRREEGRGREREPLRRGGGFSGFPFVFTFTNKIIINRQ